MHSLTHTSQNTVTLKKFTLSQLAKIFPAFMETKSSVLQSSAL